MKTDKDMTIFDEIYDMYTPHVYRFARALTRDAGDAEDLFQETWLRAYRAAAEGVEPRGSEAKDWDTISHSSQQGKRTPQAREVLQGYGISVAGDRALMKAHLIWHGGVDPEEVLNRRTAPKTNSFMHNIHDLGKTDVVTVDGRASDEHEDTMRPWDSSRGINSAATKTGKVTRYEVQENSFREAARARGIAPHQMQAVTWEQGKNVERNWKPGRKQGDARKGQSYQGRIAEFRGGGGA